MKDRIVLFGLVILKFILQYLVIHDGYELHRDEFLHLDQAHHLAWSYSSVPPFTSWISYLIYLLGNSVFWVKFFPALFGALTIVVVWKTVELFNGSLFAKILASVAVLFSVLLRINTLFQPNSFDILAWTSILFGMVAYIKTQKNGWLYFIGIVTAFGFLNKYNVVFLLFGLFFALIVTSNRKVFLNKHFYFSLLLGVILISPNLWWQYQNNFPVIHHMNELKETQLVNNSVKGFIVDQFIYFIGSLYVLIASIISFIVYKPFKEYRFLFWFFWITLSLFIYFSAKGYYAIGIYPIYLAFGAIYLDHLFKGKIGQTLRVISISVPIMVMILIGKYILPILSPEQMIQEKESFQKLGLLRWEDGKDHHLPQDFADMIGWQELTSKVDSLYDWIPKDAPMIVITDNWGEAGAINYYTQRAIQSVTFSADYLYWFDMSKSYKHLIRVIKASDVEKEIEELKNYFEDYKIMGSIENVNARERGTTVVGFVGAKMDMNAVIQEELETKIVK